MYKNSVGARIQPMMQQNNSLEAWVGDKLVFSSQKHWLEPMMELERFLIDSKTPAGSIVLHDTKAGRAAAGLAIRLGIQSVVIGTVSDYALQMYSDWGVAVSFDRHVPLLECMTERLITPSMTPDEIYCLIQKRMGASEAK